MHLTTSVKTQLGVCAAAVAGTAAVGSQANAALVTTFQNTSIVVPATSAGIYLNLETGASGTSGAVTGYDFNPYLASGGTQLGFYWGPTATRGAGVAATTTTGPYLDLAAGTTVGATSVYTSAILGTTGSPYLTTGDHVLGFEFFNAAGTIDYGYLKLTTTAANGFPATITGWVFDNAGASVTTPNAPEPSSALVGLAVGAIAMRRARGKKADA